MRQLLIAMFGISATAALAQSGDTQAILEALQKLDRRVDGMQKQIDSLKGDQGGQPDRDHHRSAPPPLKRTVAPNPSAAMRPEPGWVINVLPDVDGTREPDALFRFVQKTLPIKFNAHLAKKNISNWVKYRGEAQLQIYESGRYGFALEIHGNEYPYYPTICGGYLKVGPTVVVDLGDETKGKRSMTGAEKGSVKSVSGAINLEAGNYDIAFLAACHNTCSVSGDGSCRQYWLNAGIDVQMRGPADDGMRPFESKELIHLVRQKAASAAPQKPPGAKATGDQLPWAPVQSP